jgi:hypothetical protein
MVIRRWGDGSHARKGNESIYYIKDEDSAYVGVNRSTADIIDMRFANKELIRLFISTTSRGHYSIPPRPSFELRLRNFKWLEARRPKTKFELFGD